MRRERATIFSILAISLVLAGCSADPGTLPGEHGTGSRPAVAAAVEQVRAALDPTVSSGAESLDAPEPYAYSQLDASDQERYRILLDVFGSREARDYPDSDMDRLTRIRDCVFADHPELFSVESVHMETTSNTLTGEVTSVSVEGRYADSAEGAAEVLEIAGRAAEACFADLPDDADDYAKAKRAYEYLVEQVEYVSDGVSTYPSPDQTIEGSLVNGRAVCGGYANAYAYLLQSAGVACTTVTGSGNGVDHAWCLALLDGDYYFIDPTWGDPVEGSLNYDYLAITTEDLEQEHYAESPFTLPRCSATADNYYVREGLMFDWADEIRLAQLVTAGFNQIRCTNADAYAALLDSITSGHLAGLLAVEQYRYSSSDELLTLKVYLA